MLAAFGFLAAVVALVYLTRRVEQRGLGASRVAPTRVTRTRPAGRPSGSSTWVRPHA